MESPENNHSGPPGAFGGTRPRATLTNREREILGQLAVGLSGAQIAAKLVLSPETVRTHVRNAMVKLGASTRSQAVALALQRQEIAGDSAADPSELDQAQATAVGGDSPVQALAQMLTGLVSLYDVDGGAIYLADEDGLSLRQIATSPNEGAVVALPAAFSLGEGALGRAALERRPQLIGGQGDSSSSIAAPMTGAGRLLGLIALTARVSRPIGRSELLLLQALANRVGEVIVAGADVEDRLERAMVGFRASWSATTRVG